MSNSELLRITFLAESVSSSCTKGMVESRARVCRTMSVASCPRPALKKYPASCSRSIVPPPACRDNCAPHARGKEVEIVVRTLYISKFTVQSFPVHKRLIYGWRSSLLRRHLMMQYLAYKVVGLVDLSDFPC